MTRDPVVIGHRDSMRPSDLPGMEPAPRETHSLFFALWPDDATRARIAAAADALHAGDATRGRRIKPHRYHLTLHFLGERASFPHDLAAHAGAAAAGVHAATFDLPLDSVGSFDGAGKPCWLGCSTTPDALRSLYDQLGDALRRAGCRGAGGPRFVPHVTLLRDAERCTQARSPVRIDWHVDEFVLIHSRTQPPAPYRRLGEWPLD